VPPEGSVFRVGELLSRLPSVLELYERSFDEFAAVREASVFSLRSDASTDISFFPSARGQPPDAELSFAFSLEGLEARHRREHFGLDQPTYWARIPAGTASMPKVVNARNSIFLVPPFENGYTMPFAAMLFATSYALGMLGRYFPTTWLWVLARAGGGAPAPVVRAATEVVREQYPQRIVTVMRSLPDRRFEICAVPRETRGTPRQAGMNHRHTMA
jgi:hypothetical protein